MPSADMHRVETSVSIPTKYRHASSLIRKFKSVVVRAEYRIRNRRGPELFYYVDGTFSFQHEEEKWGLKIYEWETDRVHWYPDLIFEEQDAEHRNAIEEAFGRVMEEICGERETMTDAILHLLEGMLGDL